MKSPCIRNNFWKGFEIWGLALVKLPCKRNDFWKRFKFTLALGPTRAQCFFILDIKCHFTCGELNLYQSLTKFQNIMPTIVGVLIFSLFDEI